MDKQKDKSATDDDSEKRHYDVTHVDVESGVNKLEHKPPQLNEARGETQDEATPYRPSKRVRRYLRWKKRREIWTPIVTLIISMVALLVIAAQAIIYQKQASIMTQTLSESQKTRELENRAYIGVKSVRIVGLESEKGTVVVTFTNTGHTPSRGVATTRMCVGDRDRPPLGINRFQTPFPCPNAPSTELIFLPLVEVDNEVTDIPTFTRPTPPALPSTPTKGLKPLPIPWERVVMYVFGEIRYRDTFQMERITEFCFFNTPGRPKSFYICRSGNSFN